jgi:hypothetical protein
MNRGQNVVRFVVNFLKIHVHTTNNIVAIPCGEYAEQFRIPKCITRDPRIEGDVYDFEIDSNRCPPPQNSFTERHNTRRCPGKSLSVVFVVIVVVMFCYLYKLG